MRDEPELFIPLDIEKYGPFPIVIPPPMMLQDAISLCEALGFSVIPKDRVKTLSFHVAITDQEKRMGHEEEILESYEKEKNKSLWNQIIESDGIKYVQKENSNFQSMVNIHSWKIKVVV